MEDTIKIILPLCLAGLMTACSGGSSGGNDTSSQSVTRTSTAPSQTVKAPTPSSNTPSYSPNPDNNSTIDTPTGSRINLRWNIPTSREDGTSLSLNEIDRYEIYYFRGDAPGGNGAVITVADPAITNIHFTLPMPGTYYFAIASIDTVGVYSDVSDPLSIDIP